MTEVGLLKRLKERCLADTPMPRWIILFLDMASVFVSGCLSAYTISGRMFLVDGFWHFFVCLIFLLLVFGFFFKVFHIYNSSVRFSSVVELKNLIASNFCTTAVLVVISVLVHWFVNRGAVTMVISFLSLNMVFVTLFMLTERVFVRLVFDELRASKYVQKVFVYGADAEAVAFAKSIRYVNGFKLAGFVSPYGEFQKIRYLLGVRVWNDDYALLQHIKDNNAGRLLISPSSLEHFKQRSELINELIKADIRMVVLPRPEKWDGHSKINSSGLREIDIEDLLPREKLDINMEGIKHQLKDVCVMITGAAGSIGSEMVRLVASFHPSQMILIDQAETPMHDLLIAMTRDFGSGCQNEDKRIKFELVVGSITDSPLMEKLFSAYRPEYVFHAAAYKHVPMMEDNPAVAIRNNLHGTRIIADLAVKYEVTKFVMISSDKAVNPTNVMGCSKRLCEIYCQSLNNAVQTGKVKGKTQFVTTRFGNVLGSSGSVIPLFREQIAHGGPVTVTNPEIIRYFMLIPEACKLVLEAGVMGKGGEIFAFDMGKPVKIADLARKMIALSGAKDVEIVFTGLRDGEKLYEEVLSDREKTMPTPHPKIWVASVREYDYGQACREEERLVEASYGSSAGVLVSMMEEIVPEYRSNNEKYV